MLWNVAHRWNRGSRFAFNRYWHWIRCLVWLEPGKPALVIHSKEGIMQGNCLAMSLYGVALMPLASKMQEAIGPAGRQGIAECQVPGLSHEVWSGVRLFP